MGHSYLDPGLQRFVDHNDPGFFLKDRKAGEVFEVETSSGSVYTFVVDNPEKGEVAISSEAHEELRKPTWFSLQGSTMGGSAVRLGWIGLGLRVRLHSLTGDGLALLSETKSIRWLEGEVADKARAAAEETRPREPTEAEVAETMSIYRKFLDELPWGKHEERAKKLIGEFSFPSGQVVIATILNLAMEAGKIEQAFSIVERDLEEHWSYRPPQFRGEFITEKDVDYIERAYRELGIEPPKNE